MYKRIIITIEELLEKRKNFALAMWRVRGVGGSNSFEVRYNLLRDSFNKAPPYENFNREAIDQFLNSSSTKNSS